MDVAAYPESLPLWLLPLTVLPLLMLVRENFGNHGLVSWRSTAGEVHFTAPGVDNVLDLHGDVADPDLVVFFSGNQFMMVPELMRAFQEVFPRYQRIYFETLPPAILEEQIRTGCLVVGNLRITLSPDVLTCGQRRMHRLHENEDWFDEITPYLRNRLGILVRQGNPKGIRSWEDLGRSDVRVSMPSPATEGMAEVVLELCQKVGGPALTQQIMQQKVADGTTFLAEIHHRQTPLRILRDESDAGPAWYTEGRLQQAIGNPLEMVEMAEELCGLSTSVAGRFRDAPHPQAARDFLVFLRSTEAERIYRKHGFLPLAQEQRVAQV